MMRACIAVFVILVQSPIDCRLLSKLSRRRPSTPAWRWWPRCGSSCPAEPWSAVRRLIENRHVQINGNLCLDEGRKLQEGDVVKVWDEPRNAPPGRRTSRSSSRMRT